jgi:hypothetical protein
MYQWVGGGGVRRAPFLSLPGAEAPRPQAYLPHLTTGHDALDCLCFLLARLPWATLKGHEINTYVLRQMDNFQLCAT